MLTRRGFIFGAGATLAVVRTPGLLMPIKSLTLDEMIAFDLEAEILPPGTYTGRVAFADFQLIERRVIAHFVLDNVKHPNLREIIKL